MSLEARVRPAEGEPEGALVLLHGRGADELDLFPLLDLFDPDRRLVGATPRAPLPLPPGGWHWYAFREVGSPDPGTFDRVYPEAAGWLDEFLAGNGVPADRLVLGGFSQGAVMAYALDPVIPVEFGRAARALLEEAGAEVHYREYPLPHTIDPGFARDLRTWIADHLEKKGQTQRV